MQPNRRAFLLGRKAPRTPWEEFCERISASVLGELQQGEQPVLRLAHVQDARRARELADRFGVTLALVGAPAWTEPPNPCLWLDPAGLRGWHTQGDRIIAEPGCPVGELTAAGLPQFAQADPAQTVAAWLAGSHGWKTGHTRASGLHALDLLFSDGTTERLGAFGHAATEPLQSVTVQQLVPALFQLCSNADARDCLAASEWAGRFRLDAMQGDTNLAHVLLGHGGALAWVESSIWMPGLTLEAVEPAATPPAAAWRLDRRIKEVFDPHGRFPEIRSA